MVCCRARGYERKQQAGCPAPGEEAGGNHSTAFSGCNQASGALFGLTGFSNALVDRSSARFLPNGNSRSCPSRRFLPFQPMRLLAEREHAHFNPPADQRQEIGPGPVRPRMRTRRPDQYPGGRHRVPRPHLRWAVAVGVVPSTRVPVQRRAAVPAPERAVEGGRVPAPAGSGDDGDLCLSGPRAGTTGRLENLHAAEERRSWAGRSARPRGADPPGGPGCPLSSRPRG
jgi:hypothetical protein